MAKLNRKFFSVLSVLFALVLALGLMVGCGGGTTTGGTDNDVDDPNAPHYTVTLDANGGTFEDGTSTKTLSVQEGKAIDFKANAVTMEGNDHLGWYKADGTPWPGARKVTENVSLRAKWSVAQEVVQTDLVLTESDGVTQLNLAYEDGVYQFTYSGSVFGYVNRVATYTIYAEELEAAIAADDGSQKLVLLRIGSNYAAPGEECYGLFYNDGMFDLFYSFSNAQVGGHMNYPLLSGYWTYQGYTPPFPREVNPGAGGGGGSGSGGSGAHGNYYNPFVTEEPEDEEQVEHGENAKVIYTVDATNSETMSIDFYDDGTFGIMFDMGDMGKTERTSGRWVYEDGTLTLTDAKGNAIDVTVEDGTATFEVGTDTFAVVLAELEEAIGDADEETDDASDTE